MREPLIKVSPYMETQTQAPHAREEQTVDEDPLVSDGEISRQ
jgi:hypothetical protein